MLQFKHYTLSGFDGQSPILNELYGIFKATLKPDISYREFKVYYFKHKPHLLDISFLKEGEKTIGFICASFYRHCFGGKNYTICRGAVGIVKEYRGGRLPNWLLCWKYMKYKFSHPWQVVYLNGFMANPLIYAMICKYTHKVYPKAGIMVNDKIEKLRQQIVNFYNLRQQAENPFVLKIHFQVNINAADEKRIFQSADRDVNYYLELNPHFQQQYGVLTIVPVNWSNIFVSILQAFFIRPLKKYGNKKMAVVAEKWPGWKTVSRFANSGGFSKLKT